MHTDKVIVFYDGVCNLCNASVQFLIKRDIHKNLNYAHLQSDIAKDIMGSLNLAPEALESFILFERGKVYTHSSGVLRTLKYLRLPWGLLKILLIIPAPLRNLIYNKIARNRYQLFGQTETCMLPSEEIKRRFLS